VFPALDPWYQEIGGLAVHFMSDTWKAPYAKGMFRVEFGAKHYEGRIGGIPYNVVRQGQPLVPVRIYSEPSEGNWEFGQSDLYPAHEAQLPIPLDASREGEPGVNDFNYDHDRHLITVVVDGSGRALQVYEMWHSRKLTVDGRHAGWACAHISVFDCSRITPQRPLGKTSADAAGLAIMPALFTWEDMQNAMNRDHVDDRHLGHALRFTLSAGYIRRAFMLPGTTPGKSSNVTSASMAPMGARARLRQDYSLDVASPVWVKEAVSEGWMHRRMGDVLVATLKRFGMFVSDIGMNLAIVGCPHSKWVDSESAGWLEGMHGSDLEYVDTGAIYTGSATDLSAASRVSGLPIWTH